jgi:hypothetical protein
MNAFIMIRARLSFYSSPDKGRAGGVCSDKISFLPDLSPQTPLNPPLSGGKWANKRFPTPYGGVMQWPREPNDIHAIALLPSPRPLGGRGWPGRARRGSRSVRRTSAGNFETLTTRLAAPSHTPAGAPSPPQELGRGDGKRWRFVWRIIDVAFSTLDCTRSKGPMK